MITRAKLSAVRANYFVIVEQFTTFSQFDVTVSASGVRPLFEGGAF